MSSAALVEGGTIFEAMQTIWKWYDKHLEAAILSRDLDVPTEDRLHAEMKEAEKLALRLAGETWLIPPHCRDRLDKMVNDQTTLTLSHGRNTLKMVTPSSRRLLTIFGPLLRAISGFVIAGFVSIWGDRWRDISNPLLGRCLLVTGDPSVDVLSHVGDVVSHGANKRILGVVPSEMDKPH
jgi:hypothetical protein